MERISMFVVSLIIVSISVVAFGVYYSGISTGYNTQTPNTIGYNQMENISTILNELNNKKNEQPETKGFAALGDFLSYGWNTMRVTLFSLDYFNSIMIYGVDSVNGLDGGNNGFTQLIITGIGGIVLVIFMFLVIQYWGGRNAL